MREILFRGKIENDGWIYGGIVHQTDFYGDKVDRYYIIDGTDTKDYDIGFNYRVIPETVGQYTGLKDKNGKMIFEGDIIKTCRNNIGKIEFGEFWDDEYEVEFYGYAWVGKDESNYRMILSLDNMWDGHEVIGNIHDNPELLKGN